MKHYLTQNSKMKKSSLPIYNFGIPAYRSCSGFVTCPMAGICKVGCYARQGHYNMPGVINAYEERLKLTKSPYFVDTLSNEIIDRNIQYVRIHDSGDFYSQSYMRNWFKIARLCPYTKFYAYTKMTKMFQDNSEGIPENMTIIYSEGGKQDHLINRDTDRHSRVFDSTGSLKKSGYTDTIKDDAWAFNPKVQKVGLVYHGVKSKQWSTNVKQ